MIGQNIDGYSIKRELGNGSIGKCFLATRAEDEKVVIKIAEELAYLPALDELRQQVEELASPCLVPYIKTKMAPEEQVPYLAIEYQEGTTLTTRINEGESLSEEKAYLYFQKILQALAPLHLNNLSHGSLRPENIIIGEEEQIYLTDFGLTEVVRELNQEAYMVYVYGKVIGRNVIPPFRYFSPNRIHGQPSSPKDDIFSLGVVLYHMFTGEVPSDNAPSQFCGKLDMALEKVLMKMVGDVSRRYTGAAEVLAELEKIRDGLSFSAPSVSTQESGFLPGLSARKSKDGMATTKLHLNANTGYDETTKLNLGEDDDFELPDIEDTPEVVDDEESDTFDQLDEEISELEEKHRSETIPLTEEEEEEEEKPKGRGMLKKLKVKKKGRKKSSSPPSGAPVKEEEEEEELESDVDLPSLDEASSEASEEIFTASDSSEESEDTLEDSGDYSSDILTDDLLEDSGILEAAKEFDSQLASEEDSLPEGDLAEETDLLSSMEGDSGADFSAADISDPGLNMGITDDIVLEEFDLPDDGGLEDLGSLEDFSSGDSEDLAEADPIADPEPLEGEGLDSEVISLEGIDDVDLDSSFQEDLGQSGESGLEMADLEDSMEMTEDLGDFENIDLGSSDDLDDFGDLDLDESSDLDLSLGESSSSEEGASPFSEGAEEELLGMGISIEDEMGIDPLDLDNAGAEDSSFDLGSEDMDDLSLEEVKEEPSLAPGEKEPEELSPEEALAMLNMMSGDKKEESSPPPPPSEPALGEDDPLGEDLLEEESGVSFPATNQEGRGDYSLLLTGLRSNKKKEKAAKLIALLRGIPEPEAMDMTNKLLVKVFKNVPQETAEEALEMFKSEKLSARITKKRR